MWVVVGRVILSLSNHRHCAGDLVSVRHDAVSDSVNRAPDIVLRVLVGAAGVVNCLCLSLCCSAQGATSAKLQGGGIAKVMPFDLTCECVHFMRCLMRHV